MSKALSLKLQDSVFEDVENILKDIGKPRNRYINEALVFYNRLIRRKQLKAKLRDESNLLKGNSMSILHELEEIEDEIFE